MATATTDLQFFITDEGLRWMQNQLAWEQSLRRLRDQHAPEDQAERASLERAA
jgi:hypothetical protein